MSTKPQNSLLADRGYDFLAKILIVGEVGVGKTNTIIRYCEDKFECNTLSTLGIDFKFKDISYEGSRIRIQMWDTAGQEKYRTITRAYYNGAMGVVLVYSVTDRESFLSIKQWMTDLKEHTNAVIVLVSNKNDCTKEERKVSSREGQNLANLFDVKYFEASAKTGENIENIFSFLVGAIKTIFGGMQSMSITGSRLIPIVDKSKGGCSC